MKWIAATMLVLGLLVAACGGDDDDDGSSSQEFSQTQQAGQPEPTATKVLPPCQAEQTEASAALAQQSGIPVRATNMQNGGNKTYDAEPPMTIDQNKKYFATIKMDIGDIRLELFPKDAPRHVNSFVFLARDGFYNGVTFHRVIPGFVAQAGDPTGTGSGGPGYTIPDEVNGCKFLDGTLGMAKTAAPNSAGSQWFIDYAPQPALDGNYTVFGQLVSGRDVLDKITPRDPARATQPGTAINTIEIEEQ